MKWLWEYQEKRQMRITWWGIYLLAFSGFLLAVTEALRPVFA